MPYYGGGQVGTYRAPTAGSRGSFYQSRRFQEQVVKMAGRAARKAFDNWAKGGKKTTTKTKTTASRPVRAMPGLGGARVPSRLRYAGARNTPATAKLAWSTGQSLNRIRRPTKGNFGPKGTIVVNKKRGRQLALQKKKFDQSTYTTAFIGSNPNLDAAGNMGKLDERYTFNSVDSNHSTGWVYNVGGTSNYWNPMEKGKIGNQVILGSDTAHNNFYLINAANSDITPLDYMIKQQKLPETSTPFNTGELPVQHIYRTPNTILASVDLNLKFTAASAQANLVTVQVVRATAPIPIVPGNLGHEETESPFSNDRAKFMLTNSINRCNGHYLQILYTKTFLLPGVNLNSRNPKSVYVKKNIKMNYLRSTCRRESSAAVDDLDYTLGGEWKATFSIDESGAMFNNVYVKVLSRCVTKTAKCNMMVGDNDGALGTVSKAFTVPTLHNMDSSTGPFEHTTLKNARFRYGGTIGVKHYCQDISRGFGDSTMSAVANLQSQIAALQAIANGEDPDADTDADSECATQHSDDDNDGDHCDDDSDECDHCSDDNGGDEDCGSGHAAGASPPGDGHTHPNSLTAEEHDANCQHSH